MQWGERARIGAGFGAIALAAIVSAHGAAAADGPPPPPVTVQPPIAKRIASWDEYTGRFDAFERVELRARVSGFIDSAPFKDGQLVKQGDLLFVIDPKPYELALETAKAEIARAKAQVDLASSDLRRAEGLDRDQTITRRDLDQRRASLSVAIAQRQAAETALKVAELNLEWTHVRSPIAGRVSNKRVDVGNLISGGQKDSTLLTTVVATAPINFIFDVAESDYLRAVRQLGDARRGAGALVKVKLADEDGFRHEGKLDFVDNEVNARSGVIRLRATFANQDQLLIPGVFGRARLFGADRDALLAPDSAIVADQSKRMLLTVGPGDVVVPKPVTLGPMVDGLRVVQGIEATDKVIVGGFANPFVRPGSKVTPMPAPPPGAAPGAGAPPAAGAGK